MKFEGFGSNYFHGKNFFFVADGFQSIFDYQPTLNVSGLKKTQRY